MSRLLVFIYVLFCASNISAQIDSALVVKLQTVLVNSVNNSGNHGVSAFLIMPNGQTWSGQAGVNHVNKVITDSTIFNGASTTKLNIAVLSMLLVQEGKLDLDKPWTQYLKLNTSIDSTITVRQLLNHTSGIRDYLEVQATLSYVTTDYNRFFTPKEIAENVISSVPDFKAGTNFSYSSSNYVLAALVIEALTGNSIQKELRNRIWTPLDMKHTYFGAHESYKEMEAGVWWNFGNGLTNYSAFPSTSMLSYGYGGANIVSCPADLAKLIDALFNKQFLNAQSMKEMLTFVPKSFSSWTAGYGLGIHHINKQGKDTLNGHDGYYTNLTDAFYSKNYDFVLVTMSNTQTSQYGIFNGLYNQVLSYLKTARVDGLHTSLDVKLYPNPNTGQFKIQSPYLIDEVIVSNTLGQELVRTYPMQYSTDIELIEKGVYYVKCSMGNSYSIKKVVVNY